MSMSLTLLVKPSIGPVPSNIADLVLKVAHEALAGVLIGSLFTLILQATQMAGSILDLQLGLSMSQVLNPVSGVSVTVLSQFKFMLSTVIFLASDAHHTMFLALVKSYTYAAPGTSINFMATQEVVVQLIGHFSLLALQIAAPVFAVSLIVDAGLGLISKAVPQMQVYVVGTPAKTLAGLSLLSLVLPALMVAIRNGVYHVIERVPQAFGS